MAEVLNRVQGVRLYINLPRFSKTRNVRLGSLIITLLGFPLVIIIMSMSITYCDCIPKEQNFQLRNIVLRRKTSYNIFLSQIPYSGIRIYNYRLNPRPSQLLQDGVIVSRFEKSA